MTPQEWRWGAIRKLKALQREEQKSDSWRNSIESAEEPSLVDDKSSLNEYSVFLHDGKGEWVTFDSELVAPVSKTQQRVQVESDSDSYVYEEFDN